MVSKSSPFLIVNSSILSSKQLFSSEQTNDPVEFGHFEEQLVRENKNISRKFMKDF